MTDKNIIGENIKLIRDVSGKTQEQFGELFGISRNALHTYESGRTEPKQLLRQMIASFAGITLEKLMFNKLDYADIKINSTNDTFTSKEIEDNSVNGKEIKNLYDPKVKEPNGSYLVPVFQKYGAAGPVEVYDDHDSRAIFNIQLDIKCDRAEFVYGNSAYPTITNGDMVGLRKVVDKELIHWGHIYLIVTRDLRIYKRIQRHSDQEFILALSDNDETRKDGARKYEPMEIPKDKIIELWHVLRVVHATDN